MPAIDPRPAWRKGWTLLGLKDIQRATVHFEGHVQGVGFRYSVLQLAREFEVTGFVQNLPDGRVLVEAEGALAELERFIAAIGERMEGFIRKTERHLRACTPQFRGFTIR